MNLVDLDKILVIGGGSAGLISALMLKKTFVTKAVSIIKSEKLGIIGVGESTTEHMARFMKHIGISREDLIKHCGATLKAGVFFQGFGKDDFMHSISPPYANTHNAYYYIYGQLIGYKKRKYNLYPEFFNYSEMPVEALENENWIYQYHLNTFKFNEYLLKLCTERGIEIIDDDLQEEDIILNDNGDVEKIIGRNPVDKNLTREHKADLYIDCTGFKRLLANKLKFKWVSYKEYLPLNSAVAFPTEETSEYNLYTLAKAMKHGWLWRIPTQTRTGNGYVFNKDFASLDDIRKEINSTYNKEIEIQRSFEFEPGYYEEMWKNNVVVAGLASSFIEPLEATSIGSTIQQMFILMHFLPSEDKVSNNKQYNYLMENIFSFVSLHYKLQREDTPFWKHVKTLKTTDFLKHYLPIWKNRLPQDSDFNGSWNMFYAPNFINVLFGLDLFDLKKIVKEARLYPFVLRANATKIFRNQRNWEKNCLKISHKKFIDMIYKNKPKNLEEENVIY